MDAIQARGTGMVIRLGGFSRYLALNREAGESYSVWTVGVSEGWLLCPQLSRLVKPSL